MSKRLAGTSIRKIAWALSICGAGCWSSMSGTAASDPISIGAVLPLMGDAAHWGIPPRAGGIGGRELALVIADDRCSPAEGVSAFNVR